MKKFDTILWRINGVILFCFSLFALCGMLMMLSELLIPGQPVPHETGIVTVDEETQKEVFYELGQFSAIPGTEYTSAPLYLIQDENGKWDGSWSSDYRSNRECNYYFMDLDSLKGHWLFPENKRIIISHEQITKYVKTDHLDKCDFETLTVAHVFNIRDFKDKDEQLGNNYILVSSPTGDVSNIVIDDFDSILGQFRKSDEEYVIIVTQDKSHVAYHIDLAELKLIRKVTLDI